MGTVYVKKTMVVGRPKGGVTTLRKGDPFDDAHPLVLARPDLFEAEPAEAAGRQPRTVERATRAPGELRRTRRPRRVEE